MSKRDRLKPARALAIAVLGMSAVAAPVAAHAGCGAVVGTQPSAQSAPDLSPDPDWRRPDPEDTIYFELPTGRVVLELAPEFAPRHAAQIRRLVREGFFDGGGVVRSQDNYVAQWGTRSVEEGRTPPELLTAGLPAEFERPALGLDWFGLEDPDTYASEVGFVNGLAVARTWAFGSAWVVHCYGAVGVARDTDKDSGNGTQLYAVTGQAPRHLDRNLTMVGRVISGMEHLTTLPRGTEALGFYATEEEIQPIRSAHVAADLPEDQRTRIEVMRTDGAAFREYVASRRNRTDPFFVQPAGAIDVCNVRVPTRRLPR